ncbi:lactonase family protein [Paenibacillus piri]|uniref:Lactonase family protein n=1 Tax=Paenibacillus piri TaxID=2547395 RepID=A0A4R5KUM9_9BACL|nr:lactonase family protein [Paenibacillus piri]TDF98828.1 lactonase family protein [Paenibacillus piri]
MMYVFIGCVAADQQESMFAAKFDEQAGSLSLFNSYRGMPKTAYFVTDASRNILYAVGSEGKTEGRAASYRFEPADASLQLIGMQSSEGVNPNYASVDPSFSTLFAVNFGGGSICAWPLREGGTIEPVSCSIQHEGSSIIPGSQNKPHPHSIVPDPSNQFVIVPDLGTDRIYVYRVDYNRYTLTLHRTIAVAPGTGPRHFMFHPAMKDRAYCINEHSSTITVYAFDEAEGMLRELQAVSTLPAGCEGANKCADIRMTPDCRFVYGTNRGHDSIAAYRVREDGTLSLIDLEPARGHKPRCLAVSPAGDYLLAANEGSNRIEVFAIDRESGRISPRESVQLQASPICLSFMN